MQNLKYIDSLRGIAIIGVLLVHSQMFMNIYHVSALPFNLGKKFTSIRAIK